MSDKPLVQQALASEIAELVLTISSTSSSLAFLHGFWKTTVREWGGIDRLRYLSQPEIFRLPACSSSFSIDKYYMLVRRFVNASFRLLMRTEWDKATCSEYNNILVNPGGPLWFVLFSRHLFRLYLFPLKAQTICVFQRVWHIISLTSI